jgi:aspartate/methionine/tyrosine aminotransferase
MRSIVRGFKGSLIREVANEGLGLPDVLAFWFGEGDEVTPEAVRQAAMDSIGQGETFYSHNLGMPELRQAIADYTLALHPQSAVGLDRIAVTSGGVNALMVAFQALVDVGDEVLLVTPIWPNLMYQPTLMGGVVRTVSLKPNGPPTGGSPDPRGAWRLDLDELLKAITPQTKVLVLNSPNNPSGWTLSREEQVAILARCRETGTWILADEVYERLYFEPSQHLSDHDKVKAMAQANINSSACAPSFLDLAGPEDRLMVAHSFSKSFMMTGWRLGWLVLPTGCSEAVGKLIEFNTICAPVFVQRAGRVALAQAALITPQVVAHLQRCRDRLVVQLQALPRVQVSPAPGGLYAFFRLDGEIDSLALTKKLVREARLGLAPGSAFFPTGQTESAAWLRWCFASQDLSRLDAGVERLSNWLKR